MDTATFTKRNTSPRSRTWGLLRSFLSLLWTLASAVLSLVFIVFIMLVNQNQKELEELEDKPGMK
jgi:hypothetical protein